MVKLMSVYLGAHMKTGLGFGVYICVNYLFGIFGHSANTDRFVSPRRRSPTWRPLLIGTGFSTTNGTYCSAGEPSFHAPDFT